MDGQLQALIDAVDLARDDRSILNALKNFTVACGFDRFAYLLTVQNNVTAFSDYSAEWQARYLEQRFNTIDPVVSQAKRSSGAFVWSMDNMPPSRRSSEERKFLAEAADFGVRSGVTIPLEVSFGGSAMLTLASERSQITPESLGDPRRAATALAYVHLKLNMISNGLIAPTNLRLSVQEATCLYGVVCRRGRNPTLS